MPSRGSHSGTPTPPRSTAASPQCSNDSVTWPVLRLSSLRPTQFVARGGPQTVKHSGESSTSPRPASRFEPSHTAACPVPAWLSGIKSPTDGLLARRLGYGVVHYPPQLPGTPRGPRAMRILGHDLRAILFIS